MGKHYKSCLLNNCIPNIFTIHSVLHSKYLISKNCHTYAYRICFFLFFLTEFPNLVSAQKPIRWGFPINGCPAELLILMYDCLFPYYHHCYDHPHPYHHPHHLYHHHPYLHHPSHPYLLRISYANHYISLPMRLDWSHVYL